MLTKYIRISTKGNTDIIDITQQLEKIREEEGLEDAVMFLSVIGSTAAITTMEYEPGLVRDLKEIFEKTIPFNKNYAHNLTWNDANGHSHLRSSLVKTNFFISVTDGKLDLGTWQQVVLIDFDTRPREREIVVKIIN
ncbi:MAG: secondary thiamine-phosphate synthase enzyme YjbQ [Candidatus Omnitrophica bacterium]|nr:secondary thiamine-phosphate synthase enzyme YjbQ [Candidatus Omnitrophota bacterium]